MELPVYVKLASLFFATFVVFPSSNRYIASAQLRKKEENQRNYSCSVVQERRCYFIILLWKKKKRKQWEWWLIVISQWPYHHPSHRCGKWLRRIRTAVCQHNMQVLSTFVYEGRGNSERCYLSFASSVVVILLVYCYDNPHVSLLLDSFSLPNILHVWIM